MFRFFNRGAETEDLINAYKKPIALILKGLETDENDELSEDALRFVAQYKYREKFKLSWREFLEEPYHIFIMNQMIEAIIIQNKPKPKK